MAFAINSAPFEPAISVRKHRSLNTTKRPLKGPTAQGCKPLFISQYHPPLHPEVCAYSRLLPRQRYTRLGSRSAREGHNSCSIGGGARLLPPGPRESRKKSVGEGSTGWAMALWAQASPSRGSGGECVTWSGKGQAGRRRKPPPQPVTFARDGRVGYNGGGHKASTVRC